MAASTEPLRSQAVPQSEGWVVLIFMLSNDRNKLTLLMIVKNESKQIARALESCIPYLSGWIIVDTGSVDETKDIIRSKLGNIPGFLFEREWKNFGHNRSELLSLYYDKFGLSEDSFALCLDADHVLEVHDTEFFNRLPEANQYFVKVKHGNLEFRMPYLIRMNIRYNYVGVTHEYLNALDRSLNVNYDGISIKDYGDGGAKSDKLERDLLLLSNELTQQPENSRTNFYLGQTFHELGRLPEALESYELAVQKSIWIEEKYVARLRKGKILQQMNRTDDAKIEWLGCIAICNSRPESFYYLGKVFNDEKSHTLAKMFLQQGYELQPSNGILFVERWIEKYGLSLELGVALWWLNDKARAKSHFESLSRLEGLPKNIMSLVMQNLKLCE